jgi:molybdopterin synthase catalytic subunit
MVARQSSLCNKKNRIYDGEVSMVEHWIKDIKKTCPADMLGMILVHNGIVRATTKDGKPVKGMKLSYDQDALDTCVGRLKQREGLAGIRTWINHGALSVGDDIMYLLVAGRFRTDVLPVLQELLSAVKNEIIHEEEIRPEEGNSALISSLL